MKNQIILISCLLLSKSLLFAQLSPLNDENSDSHMVFLNYRLANENSMLLPAHMISMHRNWETASEQNLSLGFSNTFLFVTDTLVLNGGYSFHLNDQMKLDFELENKATWLLTGNISDIIDGQLSLDYIYGAPLKKGSVSPLGIPSLFKLSNKVGIGYNYKLSQSIYSLEDSFLNPYTNEEELEGFDFMANEIIKNGLYGEISESVLMIKDSWIWHLALTYRSYLDFDFNSSLKMEISADYLITSSRGMIGLTGISTEYDILDSEGISGMTIKTIIGKVIFNISLQKIQLYSIAESDPTVSVSLGWRL